MGRGSNFDTPHAATGRPGIAIVRLSDLFPRPGDGAGHGVATDPPTVVDELLNDAPQIRRVLIW